MPIVLWIFAFSALALTGAIFGFFYAWVCSTMWGLDAAEPRVAVAAMQAMNASVRNIVFAPAFFGTPIALALTALLAGLTRRPAAASAFGAAALVYAVGGLYLTLSVNVPMNEALAAEGAVTDPDRAQAIWAAYSPRWQLFNQIRTAASGIALLLTGLGLVFLGRRTQATMIVS